MARGGANRGQGRKPGSLNKTPPTEKTERLYDRLTKEEKEALLVYLEALRDETGNIFCKKVCQCRDCCPF